jgi:hypothetical protein
MTVPHRGLVVCAVGLLWLDAALLGYAGFARGRVPLLLGAGACLLASLAVLVAWRRYRRMVAEVTAAQRDLARDVEAIQALLRARPAP